MFGFDLPRDVIVLGFITGLSYAVLGVGLTLVYRTSRVLNFAHGELGALGAVVIPVLVVNHGWSYWAALPLALLIGLAGGALMELVVIRRLERAPRLLVLVATIGAGQLFFVANLRIPKVGALASAPYPTPFHADVTLGDLHLGAGQLMILGLVPVMALALALFLRSTRIGLAARAAADNLDAARLAGVPVRSVSLAIWMVAGVLATLSAILIGPTRPVLTQVAVGPSLMVRALAAAMIGRLTSFPTVFAGGVAIGVLEALVLWNYPTGGTLEVVLFAVIVVSLLAQRGLGQLARQVAESSFSLAGSIRPLPARLARHPRVRAARRVGLAILLIAAVLVPLPLSTAQRFLFSGVVLFAVMGLSLVVLTGYAGQVSLGQFAFVGLGAAVGGRLYQLGYPGWVGVIYAALAGVIAALVIGLPALRIRGLFLAVTTLAFAVASSTWLFRQPWLVKYQNGNDSLELPRSRLLGVDLHNERTYFWLCLAVLVVVAAIVAHVRRTGLGRSMLAVRDNEAAAATLGVAPARTKLVAFVVAGVIASIAGWLYGGLLVSFHNFSQPGNFGPELSLQLIALVIFGGVTSVSGAVLGALWVRGMPYLFGTTWGLFASGAGLVLVLLVLPGGLAAALFRLRDRLVVRLTGEPLDRLETSDRELGAVRPRLPARPRTAAGDGFEAPALEAPALEARAIFVRFGGIAAVDEVSIVARQGEILGLMGPNGAGKTTLFDVLSGHLRPEHGSVLLEGVDVTTLRPEARARRGLGRTFQQARLFDDLSLAEAVEVALECREVSEAVPSLLGLPPSRRAERAKAARAAEVIDLLGLGPYAGRRVVELSTGTRRLAELAAVVAMGARVVLLDEPTAGIAQREVDAFRPVLRELRDHLGATMIVIEHDLPLLLTVADRAYVLAAGRVISEGKPRALRKDPTVVAAYLGTDEKVGVRS